MDKSIIDRFINKYNLNGSAESVIIRSDGETLSTTFLVDGKDMWGKVEYSQADLEEGEYGIYNTAQLKSLLGVMEGNLKIKVLRTREKPTGLLITSENNIKATYVLSDTVNFKPVPTNVKGVPEIAISILVDEKLSTTFVKAKNAISESDIFTVITNGSTTELIIGYQEKRNSNRVSMSVEGEVTKELPPLYFSAKYLKDILVANKEAKTGKIEIPEHGRFAHVILNLTDGFLVDYYLFKVNPQKS